MVKVIDNPEAVKRKRYNKNKKKAWRKKAQIKDVEELLEEKRREERYGGPLEERQDEELLFLDLGEEDKSAPKAVQPVSFSLDYGPSQLSGFKQRTRKQVDQPMKSHMFLKGLQGAKTTHKAKTTKDKQNAALKQKLSKLEVEAKKKNLLARETMKVAQMVKNRKKPNPTKVGRGMVLNTKKDGWADENKAVAICKENGVDEDFVDDVVDIWSKATKEGKIKVPGVRYKKTSALPAVITPEAGQSYNPTFGDHQVLLEKAVRQQLKYRRIDAKIERATTKMFPTIDEAPTEETWLKEMSEGLPKLEDDNEEEEEESEEEKDSEVQATVTGKRTTERKTKKQRKKEVTQKFKERKKELRKQRRINESNVYKIKTYNKEIKESENLLKARQASRAAYHEQKKSKPLRLGRVRYKPENIAVSFGNELQGSLRLAKPAVSLLEERFKNLQRRNLVETRERLQRSRKQKKKVMKRDHLAALTSIEKRAADFKKAMWERKRISADVKI